MKGVELKNSFWNSFLSTRIMKISWFSRKITWNLTFYQTIQQTFISKACFKTSSTNLQVLIFDWIDPSSTRPSFWVAKTMTTIVNLIWFRIRVQLKRRQLKRRQQKCRMELKRRKEVKRHLWKKLKLKTFGVSTLGGNSPHNNK